MRHRSNISKPAELTSMTDYLPYGNILQRYSFQGRRTRFMTTYHSLSRTIGKRDSTTLLDYRGARFSDPHVGGFISLDPMMGDFPGWSPYNYVMCNPVKLVDPDGKAPTDIIIIMSRNQNGAPSGQLKYHEGNLYNMNGTKYTGNDAAALQFQAALNDIRTSDNYYREGIEQLENSSNLHYMEINNNAESAVRAWDGRSRSFGKPSLSGFPVPVGSQMSINMYQGISSGEYSDFFTSVAHELSHMFDYQKGTYSYDKYPDGQKHKDPDEIRAVNNENRYRRNRNLQLRTHYGKAIDPSKLEDPCAPKDFCD